MNIIQIGSLTIFIKWLLLGAAILLGVVVLKYWLRHSQSAELNKKVIDLLLNSLFWGFIVWKGSLLLLEPSLVMKSPLSLLYFTGGSEGLVLAVFFAAAYYMFKAKRLNIPQLFTLQSLFLFCFSVLGGYHFLAYFFLDDGHLLHLILWVFILFIFLIHFIKRNILSSRKGILSFTVLFSFLNLFLTSFFGNAAGKIYFFTIEQWFFICLILFSLYIWKDNESLTQ